MGISHLDVRPWRNNPHLVQYVDLVDVRRTARTHLGSEVLSSLLLYYGIGAGLTVIVVGCFRLPLQNQLTSHRL
ncbi:MAG: hypothetical protein Ct9H300mP25_03420 [Acidobacteriota bacterium]|nr:MAG: hypothetical protein Ct9H300mP25_03420 [Acidobacteriota bacterium]